MFTPGTGSEHFSDDNIKPERPLSELCRILAGTKLVRMCCYINILCYVIYIYTHSYVKLCIAFKTTPCSRDECKYGDHEEHKWKCMHMGEYTICVYWDMED